MKSLDHKFEINTLLLRKMGWVDTYASNINTYTLKYKFALCFEKDNKYICIKENKGGYTLGYYSNTKFEKIIKIKDNLQLIKTIIEMEAFSDDYKRHFRLNKILK